jgi:transcriptional regulator with XRE-family HTH domain
VSEDDYAPEGPWQVAAGTPGNQRFGALLKNLRERSGLTPQQLADQADVHVSFVRGIERGAQAPSVAKAGPLLACLKEQHRIRWVEDGPFDLVIRDPKLGRDVAFEFKAKVKGQNRRTDVDDAVSSWAERIQGIEGVLRTFMAAVAGAPLETRAEALLRAEAKEEDAAHAPVDEAKFGRIVRMLAAADDEMLDIVEWLLLRDEPKSFNVEP